MSRPAAFRHDPVKSVLPGASTAQVLWTHEPVVCGYRQMNYQNKRFERTIPVPISASPIIVVGLGVLVASDDGYLRFFDPAVQKMYWERRLDSGIYASLILDSKRKRVIAAATSGLVVCFDLRGKAVWSFRYLGPRSSCLTRTC
jgi:outer membrane protein assembly factor BamB